MSTVKCLIEKKEIFLFSEQFVSAPRPTRLPIQWVLRTFTVIQLPARGAERKWATPSPRRRPICPHGMCKDNFTFWLYFSFITVYKRN